MREISFRAWNKEEKFLDTAWSIDFEHRLVCHRAHNQSDLDDCVLMQYTGLKDKNGREIYDGDIVEVANKSYKSRGQIAWSNHTAKWLVAFYNGAPFELGTWNTELYEVIGNIYENPELLEVKGNE